MSPQNRPIKDRLPTVDEIIDESEKRLLGDYNVSSLDEIIKNNIANASELSVELEKRAENIYKSKEKEALREYLSDRGVSQEEVDKITNIILLWRYNLIRDVSNIRKARAGITTEKILLRILKAHKINCERGRRKRGYRPDIVVPNNDKLKSNPQEAIAIAVKRTLRERWSEDRDVFNFPHGKFILLMPDPEFTESKAEDMIKRGMKEVYIPEELYNRSSFVKKYPEFKSLSSLPEDIKKIVENQKI